MWRGLLGKKIGMTQMFTEDGKRVGVTVVLAGPCPVLQLKSGEKDGYFSYQIGFDLKSEKAANKAEKGHAASGKSLPCRFVREIRLSGAVVKKVEVEPVSEEESKRQNPRMRVKSMQLAGEKQLDLGQALSVEAWADVKEVQVTAKSKGKGYQGVMKRHGYHGLRATHGVKTHHRHPGSSGSLTPARTVKGRKAAGHMGDAWVTQKGLNVFKVIPEKNLILLEGSVPGGTNGYVILRPAQPFVPEE